MGGEWEEIILAVVAKVVRRQGIHCSEEPKEFQRFVDVKEAERVYRKFRVSVQLLREQEEGLRGTWTLRRNPFTCEWKWLAVVIDCL